MARALRTLLALLLSVAACGDDGGRVPPDDEAAIADTFQPYFDPLGLEFTYGGLEDLESGPHLALYVEPTESATDQQYLDRLLASAKALAPVLFEEYPGLNSFDVCQEPVPTGPDDPARPKPRTTLVLGRRQASTIDDWSTATLADLIAATRTGRGGEVTVDEPIRSLPDYVEARAEADRKQPDADESYKGY